MQGLKGKKNSTLTTMGLVTNFSALTLYPHFNSINESDLMMTIPNRSSSIFLDLQLLSTTTPFSKFENLEISSLIKSFYDLRDKGSFFLLAMISKSIHISSIGLAAIISSAIYYSILCLITKDVMF